MNLGEWQAADWAAFGQVGALLIAIVAGVLVWLQVQHGQQVREEQTRPYVIVDFEFRGVMVMLAVTNIGSTPAKDVRINFDKPLVSPTKAVNPESFAVFREPIPMLAPGRKIVVMFGSGFDFFREGESAPRRYVARLEYSPLDEARRSWRRSKPYQDPPLVLDLEPFKYATLERDNLHQINESLKKIKSVMESWTSGQRLRINTIMQGELDERDAEWYRQRRSEEWEQIKEESRSDVVTDQTNPA